MKKIIITLIFILALSCACLAQVYPNVLVEVNTQAELTSLTVSAPFVWCRANNTLYFYDANLQIFTPYPVSAVTSVNGQSGTVALTTANLVDSLNKRYVTDANLTTIGNISGINTGDQNLSGLVVKANNLSDLTNIATAKTNLALVKSDVGLSNVDNTSDLNKPISTAETAALSNKVSTSASYGYTIPIQALATTPISAQTIFFGSLPKIPTTTAAVSKIFIRKSGTIKAAEIYSNSVTAGTAQAWSLFIRLNNTTDTLIQTVSLATNERDFSNSALNISVVAGDFIEIKSVNPTWTTAPITTTFGGYLYIE